MLLQSESAPQLEIKQNASKIYADTKIIILNPFADEYEAVNMSCKIVFSIEFELLNDTTLAGRIVQIEASVNDIKVYFMSDVTTEIMNSQVHALATPFSTLINSQLLQGY